MDDTAHIAAAAAIATARLTASPVPDLDADHRPETIEDGYRLQAQVHEYLKDQTGSVLAGWKIGATTSSMQQYLGVDGPAYGRVMASNVHKNGVSLPAADFCQPGFECEIGIRLNCDAANVSYTADSVSDIVGTIFPAIEIVENRYGDFLARGTPTLIADDFFHKACVMGTEFDDWQSTDLSATTGRTFIDGTEKGSGTGAEVMGHPFAALAWLANILAQHGTPLRENDIVLTGSVAPVIWIEGEIARANIDLEGLGDVSVALN